MALSEAEDAILDLVKTQLLNDDEFVQQLIVELLKNTAFKNHVLSLITEPSKHSGKNIGDCPQKEIVALYHEILPELRKARTWNNKRSTTLRARWKQDKRRQNLEWWEKYFKYVKESDFLMGRTKYKFQADIEWLITDSHMANIIDGRYENK